MDFETNTNLIDALRKGNESAFTHLVDLYHNRLHAYAMGLIDDHAKSQDIVQGVFIKTWEYRKKLDAKYPIKSFLYKLVYNEFINVYKKDKGVILLEQKYIETLSEVVEELDPPLVNQLISKVTQEIKNLPPKCQAIFVLSKKDGLTNKEISEYMEVSVKTVEAHITKAFEILREKLGEEYSSFLFLLFGKYQGNLVISSSTTK